MKTAAGFLILLFWFTNSFSQEYDPYTYQDIKKKSGFTDNLFFGGGFALQFGSVTAVKINPELGYKLNEKADIGIGAYYIYLKNTYYHFTDYVYGGKFFTRYYLTPNFFLTGEYEVFNIADYDIQTGIYAGQRIYVEGLPLGIGWKQPLGDRFAVLTTLMYNVLQTDKTPYSNPIFRISFIY
jgi:hypothetical protein